MASETNDWLVRTAAKTDLLSTLRLLRRSPDLGQDGISTTERETWDRMLTTPDLTVYLAEIDGAVVGTASALLMPNLGYECHPSMFIEALVVREDQRRRGVARSLIERLLGDAQAASCHKVQLLSHKRHADDGAFDFYRAVGFDPEAEGFRMYLEV